MFMLAFMLSCVLHSLIELRTWQIFTSLLFIAPFKEAVQCFFKNGADNDKVLVRFSTHYVDDDDNNV